MAALLYPLRRNRLCLPPQRLLDVRVKSSAEPEPRGPRDGAQEGCSIPHRNKQAGAQPDAARSCSAARRFP